MPSWFVRPRKGPDVFPCLPGRDHRPAVVVGRSVPAGPLCVALLLQLLVGFAGADDCAFLDARQLSRSVSGECLPANAVSVDVDRGAGDAVFAAAGLSAGVLLVVSRRCEKRALLSVGDYSLVGQLPGSSVCVEDDSG